MEPGRVVGLQVARCHRATDERGCEVRLDDLEDPRGIVLQGRVAEDRGIVDPAGERCQPLGAVGRGPRDLLVGGAPDDGVDARPVLRVGPRQVGLLEVEHDDGGVRGEQPADDRPGRSRGRHR